MANPFKKFPIGTLITATGALLAGLLYLQASGILTGKAAAWVTGAIAVLQGILGLYARMHATPLANPKDALMRPLVPAKLVPPAR